MFFIQDNKSSNGAHRAFRLEFYNEAQQLGGSVEKQLRTDAEQYLDKLMKGHNDLMKVSVILEQPAQKELSYLYQARVSVYEKPHEISVIARQVTPDGALKEALDAIEHQVHARRARYCRFSSR